MDALLASAGQEFLKQGVLAILLIGAVYAWWRKDEALLKSMEARITERESLTKALMDSAAAMRDMAEAQKDAAVTHREVAETLKKDIAEKTVNVITSALSRRRT